MALVLTPEMFAGNFIEELPRKRIPAKGRRNGTLVRYVRLRCLHCSTTFDRAASSALRTQQKCCKLSCYFRLTEVFVGGNEKHPLYKRWLSMTQRIKNVNCANYVNYGGRGILIQDGLEDFSLYVRYLTSLPGYDATKLDLLQVDRKDNDGNYCKGNLRWATRNTQVANQRTNSRGNNHYTGVTWSIVHNRWVARVDYKGRTYCSSTYLTQKEAVESRNMAISDNNLPHPIQKYTS